MRKHTPILFLRSQDEDCGPGEPYRPIRAASVLEYRWPQGNGVVLTDSNGIIISADVADLSSATRFSHLDWPGNHRNESCQYERDADRIHPGRAYVYARIAGTKDSLDRYVDGFYLQYFFFYYFNDFLNKHEGDWEWIQIYFEYGSIEAALNGSPLEVAYSGHAGGEKANWKSPKLLREGDRPFVFVAEGSHANYFDGGRYIGAAAGGNVLGCESTLGPWDRVDPEVEVLPETPNRHATEQSWLRYPGMWGGHDEFSFFGGVTGPQRKTIWNMPDAWQSRLRDRTVRIPTFGDVEFGVNPFWLFCTSVSGASQMQIFVGQHQLEAAVLLAMMAGLTLYAVVESGLERISLVIKETWKVYKDNFALFATAGVILVGVSSLFIIVPLLVNSASGSNVLVRSTSQLQGESWWLASRLAIAVLVGSFGRLILDTVATLAIADRRGSQALLSNRFEGPRWRTPIQLICKDLATIIQTGGSKVFWLALVRGIALSIFIGLVWLFPNVFHAPAVLTVIALIVGAIGFWVSFIFLEQVLLMTPCEARPIPSQILRAFERSWRIVLKRYVQVTIVTCAVVVAIIFMGLILGVLTIVLGNWIPVIVLFLFHNLILLVVPSSLAMIFKAQLFFSLDDVTPTKP